VSGPGASDSSGEASSRRAGIETARNRYAGFFGSACDCFAFDTQHITLIQLYF
jgi:hypothetical protein